MTDPNAQAFPLDVEGNATYDGGLTKREWFAGMALQGLASDTEIRIEDAADLAVEYADLTIRALNKEN